MSKTGQIFTSHLPPNVCSFDNYLSTSSFNSARGCSTVVDFLLRHFTFSYTSAPTFGHFFVIILRFLFTVSGFFSNMTSKIRFNLVFYYLFSNNITQCNGLQRTPLLQQLYIILFLFWSFIKYISKIYIYSQKCTLIS